MDIPRGRGLPPARVQGETGLGIRRQLLPAILGAVGLLAGCSVVSHYPERNAHAMSAFRDLDLDAAAAAFQSNQTSLDAVCYRMDRATALHTAGAFADSNKAFAGAAEEIDELDGRALVSLRDVAASAATMVLNDKAEPYRGEPFERVHIHTFSVLNYLMLGERAEARVQMRKSYDTQNDEKRRHEEEYGAVRDLARREGVAYSEALEEALRQSGTGDALREVNVFLDAFAFYLASVVYELNGEYDNASDVARTDLLRLKPDSVAAKEQYARCARKAERDIPDDLSEYKETPLPSDDEGEVVVFFLCGLAPVKREVKYVRPLPTGRGATYNAIAFPRYESRHNPVSAASVRLGSRVVGPTEAPSTCTSPI